jgi:hypothetical protein
MRFWRVTAVVFVVSLSVVASSLKPPSAHAQTTPTEGFAASISPLPILLSTKPGTSVSADLRVNNPSTHDEKLKVVVKTFTQDGADGKVSLHDVTPADVFVNWISFNKPVFDAPPGLWQTIKMTVNVPSTAAFGYYFAVEFTEANPPAKQAGTGTSIQGAVASFVLLNAQAPGETKQLRVTSFSADHQVYEFLPVNFSVRVHNSGNIFAAASGNIFIMRGSKQVAVLNVNQNHGLVIPGSNRLFSTSWDSGFPIYKTVYGSNGQPLRDKAGNIQTKLSWNFSQVSKLRFGHYTAKLALIYNDGTRDIPITGSLSFWVVPWRVVGGLTVILIFMTVGFWSSFKRLGRFTKRQSARLGKDKKNDN